MNLKQEISSIIQGDVADDAKALAAYSCDASVFHVRPRLVVFPKHTADIKKLVAFINAHPEEKLSLTARAAGTDMSGGPLSESMIVDMTRYINRVKEVGEGYAVAEPGAYYRDFEKETLKKNLLLPSYPASREICALGGMVSNNAGGEKSLTYGKTERYVQKIKAVLYDGNEYEFGPLSEDGLQKKLNLQNTEGELYRAIFSLIDKHYEKIKQAEPHVSKNSAGYFLWNVWDNHTFNLAKLFVGAQGTLGIITEMTFSLIHPKPFSRLLVVFLYDLRSLADIVNRVNNLKPESFESFDDQTFKLAVRYFPEIMAFFGIKNILFLARQLLPEVWMTLTGGLPKLVLLAEFTGDTQAEADEKAAAAEHELKNLNVKIRLTRSAAEAKKYWIIRRESFNLLRKHLRGKRTVPFIDDFVVRPEHLPEFLPKLEKLLAPYNLIYTIAGHVGDGNFHIIPLMDLRDPRSIEIIFELLPKVNDLVFRFGGSMTGEHNDGLVRSPYLRQMFGPEIYELFRKTKEIFDPHSIFNPGKKIGATIEYAKNHINAEK